jgi:hypothetical protein
MVSFVRIGRDREMREREGERGLNQRSEGEEIRSSVQ